MTHCFYCSSQAIELVGDMPLCREHAEVINDINEYNDRAQQVLALAEDYKKGLTTSLDFWNSIKQLVQDDED